MQPIETVLIAAFDPRRLGYVVLGHPEMLFPGEQAARRAGCIVMPQAPRAGDVRGLSSTERTVLTLAPAGPLVISGIPGTVRQPPRSHPAAEADSKPANPASKPTASRTRRRR